MLIVWASCCQEMEFWPRVTDANTVSCLLSGNGILTKGHYEWPLFIEKEILTKGHGGWQYLLLACRKWKRNHEELSAAGARDLEPHCQWDSEALIVSTYHIAGRADTYCNQWYTMCKLFKWIFFFDMQDCLLIHFHQFLWFGTLDCGIMDTLPWTLIFSVYSSALQG